LTRGRGKKRDQRVRPTALERLVRTRCQAHGRSSVVSDLVRALDLHVESLEENAMRERAKELDEVEERVPASGVSFRAARCVMLVGVEGQLVGSDLPVEILIVRSVAAACERMRVRRPVAVFVGDHVCRAELGLLFSAAEEAGAEVLRVPEGMQAGEFFDWFRAALFTRGDKLPVGA
jgi:hypothetical protein